MSNQKGEVRYRMVSGFTQFLILLAGTLVVILSLIIYAFLFNRINFSSKKTTTIPSPTTAVEKTIGWKTFTNDIYGYSFQYPSDWKVEISEDEYPDWEQVIGIATVYKPGEITGSTLGTIHTSKQKLQNVINDLTSRGIKPEENILDGHIVYRNETTDKTSNTLIKYLYFENNGFVHQLSFAISDTQLKNKNIEQVDQILASLKFIDPETGFSCPDAGVLDCTPCTGNMCPAYEPMYCTKGSPQYNFIIANCPDVEIRGL